MILRDSPLEPLRVGQVWQCRNQGTWAAVTTEKGVWFLVVGDSFPMNVALDRRDNGRRYRNRDTYHGVADVNAESGYDLVQLLYTVEVS